MKKVELLAPVGHMEGLRAAVANGADAVYIGGTKFGARKEAAFVREKLMEAIQFAHLYGVRVYVTVNTTVFDEELNYLIRHIHFLYGSGVDAVIVSDLGVASIVKELYPDFEMHFSTQMHLHNSSAAGFARRFGATRMVAARENSVAEIQEMVKTGIEVEAFVHGALCVCYSGQCLMSSMAGGRSGNRGVCAQPCRLPHELVRMDSWEVVDEAIGKYQLSPRDLQTVDDIGILIDAGVSSFKIEGRLKSAEYVAVAVQAYRHAIDLHLEGKKDQIPKQMHDDLSQVFSRDFTRGFLLGESGRHWIGPERPGHRGILIGRVIAAKNSRATIKLTRDLHLQDGLRFIGLDGDEVGMIAQKMFVNKDDVTIAPPGVVDMLCPFQPQVGMKVYKTTSVELAKRMNDVPLPKVSISGEARLMVGAPVELSVWDNDDHMVTVRSEDLVELAEGAGLSEERLRQQLGKTGGTPFAFEALTVQIDTPVTISISTINGLRREALEALVNLRQKKYPDRKQLEIGISQPKRCEKNPPKKLTVSVRTLKQLRSVCTSSTDIEAVYYKDMSTLSEALELAQNHKIPLIPQISRVMDDDQIKSVIKKLKELNIKVVMIGEYGMLEALQDTGISAITDHSFLTNNVQHVEALRQFRVAGCTASYENPSQHLEFLVKNSPLPFEVIVFGRIPLMITKHCPVKAVHESGDGPCHGRYCHKEAFGLRNRKGHMLPLIRERRCNMEVYSYEHLILLTQLHRMSWRGVSSFRLEFSNETDAEIRKALDVFSFGLATGKQDKQWMATYIKVDRRTKGRYSKGIE